MACQETGEPFFVVLRYSTAIALFNSAGPFFTGPIDKHKF
jgi:hypothetical protein